MPPSPTDRAARGYLHALLAACALLCLAPAHAAGAGRGTILVEGNNLKLNINDGTQSLDNVTLRQGTTLIRAKHTVGREDGADDSTWDLNGEVHIEFNGAVLDAGSAKVKFVNDRIRTIHVQGAPARFSHPLKTAGRVVRGRAGVIDYDAVTGKVQFSGNTQYEDGRNQLTTDALTYDINDSSVSTSEGRSQGTFQPGNNVPVPRAPERKTAQ